MSAEVTIICPTYNNPDGAMELLSDLYRLHDPEMFRFISIDQTKDGIPFGEHKPHLHIRAYRNLGFSKAMNVGWKLVQTPYTLLANDDIRILHPNWYEDVKQHLKGDVLGANPFPALRTWNAGGDPTWYWKTNPKFEWTKDKAYDSYTLEDYQHLKKDLWGGCGGGTTMFFTLLRTEAREIVGLMDEAYINNGQDYDWNRRCYLKGYKILTCTHSLVHHHCGVTKQKAAAAKEVDGYDLVAKAKNVFNKKWASVEVPNPDIYGRAGLVEPTIPWYTEVDL